MFGSALLAGCLSGSESSTLSGSVEAGPGEVSASVDSAPAAGTWPMAKRDAAATASAPAANGPPAFPLEQDWRRTTEQSEMRPAVVTDGTLLALTGNPDANLAALDPTTGEPRWSVTHDRLGHATPALAGDRAYVPWGYYQTGEYVDALALSDAARVWRATLPEAPATDLVHVGDTIYGTLEADRALIALRADSGETALRFALSEPAFRMNRLAVADGTVFAAVSGMETDYPDVGFVVAIDPVAGELRWIHETSFPVADLSVADGRVFAVAGDEVVALAGSDGEVEWSDEDFEGGVETVCVADGTVIVGGLKEVRAVHAASGEERWENAFGGRQALVAAGQILYALGRAAGASKRWAVTGIGLGTGDVRGRHQLPSQPSSASVAGGRLYVGTEDGELIAYR